MAWFFLLLAGLLEVVWAVAMKYSEGFTRLYPTLFTILTMILSFYFLSIALRSLPLGTAYAIWTGIGTLGTVVLGMWVFHEPTTFLRIICLLLILTGILGLKLLASK